MDRPETIKRWTHWSAAEIAQLRELMAQGSSYRQAGRAIGRTHAAVKYKCDHLCIEYLAETGWPTADKQRLLEFMAAGMTHREAAVLLGRPYRCVKMMAYNLGVRSRSRQSWTEQQLTDLRDFYGRLPARELADRLGKPIAAVRRRAFVLGLCKKKPPDFTPTELETIRAMNGAGWPDSHIAKKLQRDRHEVSKWRKRLRLPSMARGQVWKNNVAAGVRRQVEGQGLKNLAELRGKRYRDFALSYNLPQELPPRAVQVVLALVERGPLTRSEIKAAIGVRPDSDLVDNRRGTSYLSTLRGLGLVAYVFHHDGRRRPGKYLLTAACLDRLAMARNQEKAQ